MGSSRWWWWWCVRARVCGWGGRSPLQRGSYTGFGLEVDAVKVVMGRLGFSRRGWDVFLEPEAPLHVVLEGVSCQGRVCLRKVQHDTIVVAAAQTPSVMPAVARWIVLLQQRPCWRRHAVLHKRSTTGTSRSWCRDRTHLSEGTLVTQTGGQPFWVGEGHNSRGVRLVLLERIRPSNLRLYAPTCAEEACTPNLAVDIKVERVQLASNTTRNISTR